MYMNMTYDMMHTHNTLSYIENHVLNTTTRNHTHTHNTDIDTQQS